MCMHVACAYVHKSVCACPIASGQTAAYWQLCLTVCQYPSGMDVNMETYRYFGHLIVTDTRCLAVELK